MNNINTYKKIFYKSNKIIYYFLILLSLENLIKGKNLMYYNIEDMWRLFSCSKILQFYVI